MALGKDLGGPGHGDWDRGAEAEADDEETAVARPGGCCACVGCYQQAGDDDQSGKDEEEGPEAVVAVAEGGDEEDGDEVKDPDWGEEEGESDA